MAGEKKTVSLKLSAATADRLTELLDAYKEEGRGDRAEAFDVLLPHIERAFASDVPPAISSDVELIRMAIAMISARMDGIARAFSLVDASARESYEDVTLAQAKEIRDLKEALAVAEQEHSTLLAKRDNTIALLEDRIKVLVEENAGVAKQLSAERKRNVSLQASLERIAASIGDKA